MKKIILFSFSLISVFSVKAQITINSSGFFNLGEKYISHHVDNVTSFGGSGANQIWNFTSWTNQQYSDTLSPRAASVGLNYSSFPSANLFLGDSLGQKGVYVNLSATELDMLAYDFNNQIFIFSPPFKILSFPSSYLTSYNSFYSSEFAAFVGGGGFDSVKAIDTVTYSSIIDSWGTITTPGVSNVNCIRQKFTEVKTTTQYVKPTGQPWTFASQDTGTTTIYYRWFSDTEKSIVAEVMTDAFNQISGASYLFLTIPAGNSNGVNERTTMESDITVFPNPAADKINIAGVSQASELFVYDINGKLMEATVIKKANYSLSLSNYSEGSYFYAIKPLNGNPINKGKFTVVK